MRCNVAVGGTAGELHLNGRMFSTGTRAAEVPMGRSENRMPNAQERVQTAATSVVEERRVEGVRWTKAKWVGVERKVAGLR